MEDKNYVVIYNDQGYFLCESKDSPNDIFESDNTIVTFGKNFIEFFFFSKNNNNNNNPNNNNPKIEKKYEISINNNNNNDNTFNNNNNENEILCFELYNKFFICGHRSGFISTWCIAPNVYLKHQGQSKVSNSAINKIFYYKEISNAKDYLYLCCSDGIVHKFSLTEGKVELSSEKFEQEIVDIKLVNDFDNQNLLIISIKNGALKVLDMNLKYLFDIPSRFSYNDIRYVISLKNPESTNDNNNTKGNLLIITEGSFLDIYMWIKPGSFKMINTHHHGPHPNYHKQNQPHFQGGFYGQNQPFQGYQ